MVEYVIWLVLCCFSGYIAGDIGKYLVASMALAASDAVIVGMIIGFVSCYILEFVYRLLVESD